MREFHAYICRNGCGHTTLINKYYKRKVVFCGVCGHKETMEYEGEHTVSKKTSEGIKWGQSK